MGRNSNNIIINKIKPMKDIILVNCIFLTPVNQIDQYSIIMNITINSHV